MLKLFILLFLILPVNNSKAIGGLEIPDIGGGIGDLLGDGSKEKKNGVSSEKKSDTKKESSPLGSGLGIIKTLTEEETIEEELESGKIYASQLLGAVKLYQNEEIVANEKSKPETPSGTTARDRNQDTPNTASTKAKEKPVDAAKTVESKKKNKQLATQFSYNIVLIFVLNCLS